MPKRSILIITVIALVGLISGDPVLAQTRSECEEYARNYAKRNSGSQTLGGAVEGAAGGAIFGAILGDAGAGAGVGALIGGVSGSSRESSDRQRLYNLAYEDCIRGRVNPRSYPR